MNKFLLKQSVSSKVDEGIDQIFATVHQLAHTESGDIDPMQVVELDQIKEQLSALITDQVAANNPKNDCFEAV